MLMRDVYLTNTGPVSRARTVASAAAPVLVRSAQAGLAWPLRQLVPEAAMRGFLEAVCTELLIWPARGAFRSGPPPARLAAREGLAAPAGRARGDPRREAEWPAGAFALPIAGIGTDGRIGEWLSIPAGSPYL